MNGLSVGAWDDYLDPDRGYLVGKGAPPGLGSSLDCACSTKLTLAFMPGLMPQSGADNCPVVGGSLACLDW
jgi:hypothetical protein